MGIFKKINWAALIRADLLDFNGIMDQMLEGFRNLARRMLDAPLNGYLATDYGGHVLADFLISTAAGLGAVTISKGTYLDKDGLPIYVSGQTLDFTALGSGYGAGDSPAIWARWDYVNSDIYNRVFWDTATQQRTVQAHQTRQDISITYDMSDSPAADPGGGYDWTLIAQVIIPSPFVAGTCTVKYNSVWQRYEWDTARLEGSDANGIPLWGAVEKIRHFLALMRDGTDTDAWDDAWVERSISEMTSDWNELDATHTGWIRVSPLHIAPKESVATTARCVMDEVSDHTFIQSGDPNDLTERFAWLHCSIPRGCEIQGIHAVVVRNDVVGKTEEIRVTLLERELLETPYAAWNTIAECSLVAGHHPTGTKISDTVSITLPFTVPEASSEDDTLAFAIRIGIKNNTGTASDVRLVGAVIEVDYAPSDLRL